MEEFVAGVLVGISGLLRPLFLMFLTLLSYACFNQFSKEKKLTVIVGSVTIPILAFVLNPLFPLVDWRYFGVFVGGFYPLFLLSLLASVHLPWHDAPEEKMLSTKKVADILQIPEDTILHWINSGFIFGFGNRIPERALIDWLKKFSRINKLANKDDRIHWINRNLIEKVHLIKKQKEAVA